MAARKTGSSGRTGRACNGKGKYHAVSELCHPKSKMTWTGASDLPRNFQRELRGQFVGAFLEDTYPNYLDFFSKCKILVQESPESLWAW